MHTLLATFEICNSQSWDVAQLSFGNCLAHFTLWLGVVSKHQKATAFYLLYQKKRNHQKIC